MPEIDPVAHGTSPSAAIKGKPTAPPPKAFKSAAKGTDEGTDTPPVTGDSTISSLSQLKEVAPEVYDEMIKSIAMNIRQQMENAEKRRKKAQRSGEG